MFKTTDDVLKWVAEHINQKTKTEKDSLQEMSRNELYIQGLVEGIINGLSLGGKDITQIQGLTAKYSES